MPQGIGYPAFQQPLQAPNVGPEPVPLPKPPSSPFAGANPEEFYRSRQQQPTDFFQNALAGLPLANARFLAPNFLPQLGMQGGRQF